MLAKMATESNAGGSAEVKNAATFTPLAGSLITARQYFAGSAGLASPITLSCQKSFVLLATDGNPTSDTSGNMYTLAQQANTYNAGTQSWAFGRAATDEASSATQSVSPRILIDSDSPTFEDSRKGATTDAVMRVTPRVRLTFRHHRQQS